MKCFAIKQLPILEDDGRLAGIHLLERLIQPEVLPNAALILCGGRGTRLGSITQNIPKPMVKVAGRPILERLILHLVGSGVRQIFLAVNYLANVIEDHFGDGVAFGCEITYLRESEPLGTGGPLGMLKALQLDDPVIVMNGDLVTDFSVDGLVTSHTKSCNSITVGVKPYTHQVPFGCIQLNGSRIVSLIEKPVYKSIINAGVYVVEPSVIERAKIEFRPITDFIEESLACGERVGAFEILDWIDVGVPAELAKARGE